MSAGEMDEAMDSDDPSEVLISYLVQQYEASADVDAAELNSGTETSLLLDELRGLNQEVAVRAGHAAAEVAEASNAAAAAVATAS